MKRLSAITIVLALGTLACSSTTPPVHRYLLPLDIPRGTARLETPKRVGISNLTVAPYLAESGIVVETEARQVRAARYHRWAESLSSGLRRFFQSEISKALGYDVSADATQEVLWQTSITIAIERFHGTADGEAELKARWQIDQKGAPSTTYRFSEKRPLRAAGYPALVDTEIALARELAGAIAQSVAESAAGSVADDPNH